jgi:hypothetical protein
VRREREDDVGFLRLFARVREQPSDDRRSLSPGTPSSTSPLVVANQAGKQVRLAVLSRMTVLIARLPNVGQIAEAVPEMLLTSIFRPATPRRRDASAA